MSATYFVLLRGPWCYMFFFFWALQSGQRLVVCVLLSSSFFFLVSVGHSSFSQVLICPRRGIEMRSSPSSLRSGRVIDVGKNTSRGTGLSRDLWKR